MKKWLKITLLSLLTVVLVIIGISIEVAAKTPQKPTKTAQTQPQPPTRKELLQLVNAERAKYKAPPLQESPLLDKSAQWKADDEVDNNYFGHVKPGTTGNDGLDYLNSLHPPCSYISENLVWNVDSTTHQELDNTSMGTVNAWIKSPPHHAAMIDPTYTLTGFGISGDEIVEHFCRP